jgi:hypothetical protein
MRTSDKDGGDRRRDSNLPAIINRGLGREGRFKGTQLEHRLVAKSFKAHCLTDTGVVRVTG